VSSPPPPLTTTYTTIEWSADGREVTKRRLPRHDAARRHRYELRVNRLLGRTPPPVPTARLLAHDRRGLRFEAIRGTPLGPKYPEHLDPGQVDALVDLGRRLRGYRPRARWLRSFRSARRIELARRHGLVTATEGDALQRVATQVHTHRHFAHGDLTARNVLASDAGELVLIDWEWAGLYPPEYDLAFLWFSLADVPDARARVEPQVSSMDRFLLSALLIQLWHLQWYTPAGFRERHLRTRDELIARLLG
jgi:hypothetical protein